jgi:hypothetical protein
MQKASQHIKSTHQSYLQRTIVHLFQDGQLFLIRKEKKKAV